MKWNAPFDSYYGPKVKSEHIRRFPAHDFLQVGFHIANL